MKFVICVLVLLSGGQTFAKSAFSELFNMSRDSKYIFSYSGTYSTKDLNFKNASFDFAGAQLQVEHGADGMTIRYCIEDERCSTLFVSDKDVLNVATRRGGLGAFRARSVFVNCGVRSYEIFFAANKKIAGVITDDSKLSFNWRDQESKDSNGKYITIDMLGALSDLVQIPEEEGRKMLRGEVFKTVFSQISSATKVESQVLDCQVVP